MFLKNWYKALTAEMYNHESVTGKNTSGNNIRFTKTSASAGIYALTTLTLAGGTSLTNYNTVPYMGLVQTSYNYGGVVFGTGDTAPNPDDYKLSGSVITKISASGSVSVTQDDDGCTFTGVYTITNTDSADIVVKEVGLLMKGAYSGVFLIERTVLDEPITIPADGVGQITYTIRMNYPTA